MAYSETTRLGLRKIDDNDTDWGATTRAGFDVADGNLLRVSNESTLSPTLYSHGAKMGYPTKTVGAVTTETLTAPTATTYSSKFDTKYILTITATDKYTYTYNGVAVAETTIQSGALTPTLVGGGNITFSHATGYTIGNIWTFTAYADKERSNPNEATITFTPANLSLAPTAAETVAALVPRYVGQRYYSVTQRVWWSATATSGAAPWALETAGMGSTQLRDERVPSPKPDGVLWGNTTSGMLQITQSNAWKDVAPIYDSTTAQGFAVIDDGTTYGKQVNLLVGALGAIADIEGTGRTYFSERYQRGSGQTNASVMGAVGHLGRKTGYDKGSTFIQVADKTISFSTSQLPTGFTTYGWTNGEGPIRVYNPGNTGLSSSVDYWIKVVEDGTGAVAGGEWRYKLYLDAALTIEAPIDANATSVGLVFTKGGETFLEGKGLTSLAGDGVAGRLYIKDSDGRAYTRVGSGFEMPVGGNDYWYQFSSTKDSNILLTSGDAIYVNCSVATEGFLNTTPATAVRFFTSELPEGLRTAIAGRTVNIAMSMNLEWQYITGPDYGGYDTRFPGRVMLFLGRNGSDTQRQATCFAYQQLFNVGTLSGNAPDDPVPLGFNTHYDIGMTFGTGSGAGASPKPWIQTVGGGRNDQTSEGGYASSPFSTNAWNSVPIIWPGAGTGEMAHAPTHVHGYFHKMGSGVGSWSAPGGNDANPNVGNNGDWIGALTVLTQEDDKANPYTAPFEGSGAANDPPYLSRTPMIHIRTVDEL